MLRKTGTAKAANPIRNIAMRAIHCVESTPTNPVWPNQRKSAATEASAKNAAMSTTSTTIVIRIAARIDRRGLVGAAGAADTGAPVVSVRRSV